MSVLTRAARAVLAFGASASLVVAAPDPAGAAPGDLACVGTWTSPFTPAVTFSPHHVTAHLTAALTACTGTQSAVTGPSGTLHDNQEGTMSCTATGEVEGQGRIDWGGPGQPQSHIQSSLTLQLGQNGPLMLYTAEVTSGPLAGDTIQAVLVGTEPFLLECLGPDGLEQLSGVAPFVFA